MTTNKKNALMSAADLAEALNALNPHSEWPWDVRVGSVDGHKCASACDGDGHFFTLTADTWKDLCFHMCDLVEALEVIFDKHCND